MKQIARIKIDNSEKTLWSKSRIPFCWASLRIISLEVALKGLA